MGDADDIGLDREEAEALARPMMGRKAFLDRVGAASGLAPKEARTAVEATLRALAAALREGQDVNLGSLGKLKVAREREKAKLVTYTLKLAVPHAGEAGDED